MKSVLTFDTESNNIDVTLEISDFSVDVHSRHGEYVLKKYILTSVVEQDDNIQKCIELSTPSYEVGDITYPPEVSIVVSNEQDRSLFFANKLSIEKIEYNDLCLMIELVGLVPSWEGLL